VHTFSKCVNYGHKMFDFGFHSSVMMPVDATGQRCGHYTLDTVCGNLQMRLLCCYQVFCDDCHKM